MSKNAQFEPTLEFLNFIATNDVGGLFTPRELEEELEIPMRRIYDELQVFSALQIIEKHRRQYCLREKIVNLNEIISSYSYENSNDLTVEILSFLKLNSRMKTSELLAAVQATSTRRVYEILHILKQIGIVRGAAEKTFEIASDMVSLLPQDLPQTKATEWQPKELCDEPEEDKSVKKYNMAGTLANSTQMMQLNDTVLSLSQLVEKYEADRSIYRNESE